MAQLTAAHFTCCDEFRMFSPLVSPHEVRLVSGVAYFCLEFQLRRLLIWLPAPYANPSEPLRARLASLALLTTLDTGRRRRLKTLAPLRSHGSLPARIGCHPNAQSNRLESITRTRPELSRLIQFVRTS